MHKASCTTSPTSEGERTALLAQLQTKDETIKAKEECIKAKDALIARLMKDLAAHLM